MSETNPQGVPEALAGFPVCSAFALHWGEMDTFGHMNNVNHIRHLESSRIAYFEKIDEETIRGSDVGPILASIDCRYRFPVVYPDTLTTGTRILRLSDDRFVFEHYIYSAAKDDIAAKGHSVVVAYDYKKTQKVEIPETWLRAFELLEGKTRDAWREA